MSTVLATGEASKLLSSDWTLIGLGALVGVTVLLLIACIAWWCRLRLQVRTLSGVTSRAWQIQALRDGALHTMNRAVEREQLKR